MGGWICFGLGCVGLRDGEGGEWGELGGKCCGHKLGNLGSLSLDSLKGKAGGDLVGFVKRTKFSRMRRVLAESARRWQHSQMLKAKSMTIMQDVRQKYLAAMFTASDSDLNCFSGLVGILDVSVFFGNTAQNLATASMVLLENGCSTYDKKRRPQLNQKLLQHVLSVIEVFTADGAYDEQLAGKILKGRRLGADWVELPRFPAMKVIVKDKSHAVRRLTSRGWACDPVLKRVNQDMILAKHSPTQLVRNSIPIAQVFSALVNRRQQAGRSVVNRPRCDTKVDLRAAKHRFESCQKPLGRFVINFPDMLLTMERVAHGRHGSKEVSRALASLCHSSPVMTSNQHKRSPSGPSGPCEPFLGIPKGIYLVGLLFFQGRGCWYDSARITAESSAGSGLSFGDVARLVLAG